MIKNLKRLLKTIPKIMKLHFRAPKVVILCKISKYLDNPSYISTI